MATFSRLLLPLLLAAALPASAAEDARLRQIWPEHEVRVHQPQTVVDTVNANPELPKSDADAKAVVEELLGEDHQPLTPAQLTGEWRVRSIQGGRYGIFPYPWFKARVVERDHKLFFEKTSGSQRRSGWLLPPPGGKDAWYFVGGATVNEDPQVAYSRGAGAEGPRDSDSVGLVWGISDGRVIMLLDAHDGDYEIYQLKRPE